MGPEKLAASAHAWQVGTPVRARGRRWHVEGVEHGDTADALTLAPDPPAPGRLTLLSPFDRIDPLRAARTPRAVSRRAAVARLRGMLLLPASWEEPRTHATAPLQFLPFQYEPARALLRGEAARVLVADHVGLGKTIQAGIVLAELAARGCCRRALVVVPAGLRTQWARELAARFAVTAWIAEADTLAADGAALAPLENPWARDGVHLVSLDFVKRLEVLRALDGLAWDVLVVDEAHLAAGPTERRRGVAALASSAVRLLLLTATPTDGSADGMAGLETIGRRGDDDRLLVFRRTRSVMHLRGGSPGTARVGHLHVRPSAAERTLHDCLERYAERVHAELGRAPDAPARMAMTVLRKRAWSSPFALRRTLGHRMAALDGTPPAPRQDPLPLSPDPSDDEVPEALAAPGLARAGTERRWLALLLALAARAEREWSKLRVLRRMLRRANEPALVFTEFRDTLSCLRERLDAALQVDVLHGGLAPSERDAAVEGFCRGSTRVLLATDAAGLGLNLHDRCRLVVNVELPWNPARLEQRSGRVDRFGQTRRVHVRQLVAADTGEASLLERLGQRVSRLRERLGDGGAVLDSWSVTRQGTSLHPHPDNVHAVARQVDPVVSRMLATREACARRVGPSADVARARPWTARIRLRAAGRGARLEPGRYCCHVCRLLDADGRVVSARTIVTGGSLADAGSDGAPEADGSCLDWRLGHLVADWIRAEREQVARFVRWTRRPDDTAQARGKAVQLPLFGADHVDRRPAHAADAWRSLAPDALRVDIACPLVLDVTTGRRPRRKR